MQKFRRLARPTSYLVLVCLLGLGSYAPGVRAAIVSTEAVASANQIQGERERIKQLLDRDIVKAHLLDNGVDPAAVQERVDNLTDSEIHALATRLDEYPAGGDFSTVLVIAFLVFLTLLITDILGYTDIFPFVKKAPK